MRKRPIIGFLSAAAIVCLVAALPWTDASVANGQQATADQQEAQQEDANDRELFPGLVQALKATPGCLGIEGAETDSGKNVLFVWFADKEAAMAWYNSDVHQQLMDQFFPDRVPRDPMADIPDDSGPIMAVASITVTGKPEVEGSELPISQIAIELYAPVSGGLAVGGRFAPESVKVKKLKNYSDRDNEPKK